MSTVYHWFTGFNAEGDEPRADEITHGLTAKEALAAMTRRMREFAEIDPDPEAARAFANAADLHDADSELPGFETMLAMMEFQARSFGPDSKGGTVSHVTRDIVFWAEPCYDQGCTQTEEGRG